MEHEKLFTDLSDEQSEKVVGGVGRGENAGVSAGLNGWGAAGSPSAGHGLFHAGFTPGDSNPNSAVPVIVPGPKDG